MNKTLRRSLIAGGLICGTALINNAVFSQAKALGNPLGGEGRFWPWREGDIFYARHGSPSDRTPLLLLHGIYAGASLYEWRKNFDALGEQFDVTVIDWLGFGLSDKPNIRYTGSLYVEMLRDFIQEVIGRPCVVAASSLAAAYAIEAANALPDLVQSLVLICPTGIRRMPTPEESPLQDARHIAAHAPLLGTSLYNAMTCPAALRAYLQNQVYFDPSYVTEEMVDHYFTASHQYGSQYAPLSFLSGDLGRSIGETLPRLTQKSIRLIWGREAKMSPLPDAESFLSANASVELTVLDKAGLLPHDEQAAAFNRLLMQMEPGNGDRNSLTGTPKRVRRA